MNSGRVLLRGKLCEINGPVFSAALAKRLLDQAADISTAVFALDLGGVLEFYPSRHTSIWATQSSATAEAK